MSARRRSAVQGAGAIIFKDLLTEARARQLLPTVLLFALITTLLLAATLPTGSVKAPSPPRTVAGVVVARDAAAAYLWVITLFASVLIAGRSAADEKEGSRIDALLLSPIDPSSIFAAKTIVNLAFLLLTQAAVLPLFTIFVDPTPGALMPGIIAVFILADIGAAACGATLGAAAQELRGRELVLPALLLPLTVPVFISGTEMTRSLLETGTLSGQARWFILLSAFDLLAVLLGAFTFEFMVSE